jgi:hypothetical protein
MMDLLAGAGNTTVLRRDASAPLLAGAGELIVASAGDAIGAGEASILSWTYASSAPEGLGGTGLLQINCTTSGVCRVWCVIEWGSGKTADNIHFWCDSEYTKTHVSVAADTPPQMQGQDCNFTVKFSPINGDLDTETTTICEGCIYIPVYGEPNSGGGS